MFSNSAFKVVLLFAFFIFLKPIKAQTQKINWVTIEEAQSLQKTEAKPIFIFVYATWNGWGKRMEKDTFNDASVIDYVNANYHAVKLNGEGIKDVTYKGESMKEAMLTGRLRVRGYPTIVLLDSKLENKINKPGYKKPDGFMTMLKEFKTK